MYYNTSIRYYNSEVRRSVRYITYESARRIPDQSEPDCLRRGQQAQETKERAEVLEALKDKALRDYRQESLSRACRTIKHILRLNYSDRLKFLTLTYKELVIEPTQVLSDIKDFCRRYRSVIGKDLKYIMTMELQKNRGCLHCHLIVDAPFITSELWQDGLWKKGFIKINSLTKGKSRNDLVNAISYCLKYIQKDFETREHYDHVYYRSKNWNNEQLVEYDVSTSRLEYLLHARRYLMTSKVSTSSFDFIIHTGEKITVLDVYSDE